MQPTTEPGQERLMEDITQFLWLRVDHEWIGHVPSEGRTTITRSGTFVENIAKN